MAPASPLLNDPRAQDLLQRAQLIYVAVDSKRGPHVTPELFVSWGGKLWIATARRTLKRRTVERVPQVGATAWVRDRYLVISGEAEVYDPLDVKGLLRPPAQQIMALIAAAHFAARNALHLAGLAIGQPKDLVPTTSTIRSLVGIDPHRAIMGRGNRVEWSEGDWGPAHPRLKAAEVEDVDIPPLATAVDAAMVGWSTTDGPVALPARWDGAESSAAVSAALLEEVGADRESPGSVMVDRMDGYSINAKRGKILRGPAEVEWGEPTARISIEPEKATRWVGVETTTIDVG